jgi:hypothetical protein
MPNVRLALEGTMLPRIQVIRSRPQPWRGRALKLSAPASAGGGATRVVPALLVVLPRPGPGRLMAWRLAHVLVRATFGPPPPPPTALLALAMAANTRLNLAMAYPNTLFLAMTANNTLPLVMHGS